MKKLQGLIYFSFFFLLLACGTTKDTGRGTSPTPKKEIEDEKTRLLFEQVFLSAEKEKALGRNQDAIRDYKEALDIYPNSSGAHFALADLYLTEGRVDLAYTSINAAIKLETQIADYYDLKAQICHSLSKHVEAAKALEEIIRLQPGNVDAYFDAANQYIYAKDYKSALLIYDKMEDRFGVGEDLIRQKEQLYLRLGKANKAIEEVKKLVDAAPGDTRYQGMLAELYWTVGKQSEAVTLYREILEKEPGNGYAHFGMAEFYRSQNQKDPMLRELNEAFKDSRINAEVKLNVIRSLIPIIENDRSIKEPLFEMAETVINAHASEAEPYVLFGEMNLFTGNAEKARELFQKALDLDPSNLDLWLQYCGMLYEANQPKALLENADKALEYFPLQAGLYYYQASALRELKRDREVVEACQTGLGLYASDEAINLQLYIMLGDAQHNLNLHTESDKAFEKALEIDPENTYVLNNYAYYLSLRKADLEKAKTMSGKTLEQFPNDPSYLDTYGWILHQLGDHQGALPYLMRSLEKTPESAEVLEHAGDVLHHLKREEEAQKYWKKALELNSDSEDLKNKINGTYSFK